jgi:ubiquinone/menaquinone biosynthesis C-methylase UbiE
MDGRLQRRVQRYGWDRAVAHYEDCWRRQLLPAQDIMLEMAQLQPGERVLDIACGTGLVTFRAAEAVGPEGQVVGTDLSGEMVGTAAQLAAARGLTNTAFERGDAEDIQVDENHFDAVLCGLGLMYVPDPDKALTEMVRALKPGGRAVAAVWGRRENCGWADIFPIVDSRVRSDVCPLFFQLGSGDSLARTFRQAALKGLETRTINTLLRYDNDDQATLAAFAGGPVALAYSRFDETTKEAAHREYLESIAEFKKEDGCGYEIPGEFVVVLGAKESLQG